MEATKIDEALKRATNEFGLCPNRVWAIGHNLEGWEKKLPDLVPTSERQKSMGIIGHEGHERCTFELCEYSMLNYTSVTQRHEDGIASCREEKRCDTLKGLFSVKKLDEASLAGKPTAWRLDGESTIDVAEPYMAISHVWSDGTGNGVWPDGEVNECLYRFFERIARRWQCTGIWWDAICIPKDKAAKDKAISRMEHNYEGARITLVHDCYIRSWKWVDAETACLAIILSPWFSRGWTALELARSTRVKVIFKGNVIKDLDEDILSKSNSDSACHRFATEAIRGLRRKRVENLNDLLTVLGPRSTSKARDMARISALLVGTPKASGEDKQHHIYQQVLRKIGCVAHGHLFHRSATMAGKFSWCATNLLAMPMASQTQEQLDIKYDGSITGCWKIIKQNSVPRERYVLKNGFPLVDMKVNASLEAADKSVLLGEPDAKALTRAITAKVLDGAKHHYEFMGPVYFNPPLALDEIQWETVDYVTISGSKEDTGSSQIIALKPKLPHVPDHLRYLIPPVPMAMDTAFRRKYRLARAQMEGDHEKIIKISNEGVVGPMPRNDASIKQEERLLRAVIEGDEKSACDVLEDKVINLSFKDGAGWTALHYAVRRGYNSIVEQLFYNMRYGRGELAATVAVQDDLGQQCIHLAAERGDCGLVKSEEELLKVHKECKDGQTALHRAVLGGSLEMVMLLPDVFRDAVKDAQDSQGRTALHLCAELGQGRIFNELLSRQADILLKDNTGRTTLHYAVMDWNDTTDVDMVSTLLGYEELNVPDNDGRMPLHYAAEIGYPRYVKLLSRKTNIAVVDSSEQTALHVAVNGGHLEAVNELLEWDTERHELPQITLDTALHLAASLNHLKIVQALVDHGASIWYRDSSANKTPVEVAVDQKRAPLTMYLVELVLSSPRSEEAPAGWIEVASIGSLEKNNDASALYHAVKRDYQKVAVALTNSGEDVFVTDEIGKTIISWAVAKTAKDVVYALAYQYGQAIYKAKQAEQGLQQAAYNSYKPLDSYTYELGDVWRDLFGATFSDSWTAVMHLEQAFKSTSDPEMQALLTPDWELLRSEFPNVDMREAKRSQDQLTPLHLHQKDIGKLDPLVRQYIARYRSPDRQYGLEDEDDDDDDDDDYDTDEDEDSSSELEHNSRRRRRRWEEDSEEDSDSEEDLASSR
ncbi:hypothetical protein ZTR_03187 [Talaromyces verruculosus]|nr:hypothetical protein ZTR_03187 [Talaromyces verruculosus]